MNKELIQSVSDSMLKLRFLVAAHFMKPIREKEREKCEYPPGYMHVMGWLKSKGGPVSMTDLANSSFISKPNLTTMVDRLCAEGLVARSADVNDRRIVNVALTQKGMNFLLRQKAEVAAFIESRLELLDDSELERLKCALDDITAIVNLMGEKQENQKET